MEAIPFGMAFLFGLPINFYLRNIMPKIQRLHGGFNNQYYNQYPFLSMSAYASGNALSSTALAAFSTS